MRPILLLPLLLMGCAGVAVQGPSLQTYAEAEIDFAEAVAPILKSSLAELPAEACEAQASLWIYAQYWGPYAGRALLASSNPPLGIDPGVPPQNAPTPAQVCAEISR